jgi:Ca2+-binding EF-hand superfamily protein
MLCPIPGSERSLPRSIAAGLLVASGVLCFGTIAVAQDLPRTPQEYLKRMDGDGDGRVSRDEYVAYMIRNFDRMDADGNGVLEGDELPAGSRPILRADYAKSLAAAFRRQDGDHDGFLDARELAAPPRAR